jgi:hypothetical protein
VCGIKAPRPHCHGIACNDRQAAGDLLDQQDDRTRGDATVRGGFGKRATRSDSRRALGGEVDLVLVLLLLWVKETDARRQRKLLEEVYFAARLSQGEEVKTKPSNTTTNSIE